MLKRIAEQKEFDKITTLLTGDHKYDHKYDHNFDILTTTLTTTLTF